MTVKYKTVITKAGAEKLAAATVPNGKKVNFTAMAVGDGGGQLPVPNASQTKLVNEVWRHALNKISQDKKNKNYVVAELLVPPETGGFWMREMGLYDDAGTLIAVGNMAESYKPLLQEGSGRAQTVRMVIMVSDINAVELAIDTSMVMATQEYVDEKLAEHEQSRRHPDATLAAKGFTQLSSATDSASEALAATPKAVKAAYDLANAKYTAADATTARKGIVQLSSATDSASEALAATPKAVKAAYDLAHGKYTAADATTTQKGIVQLSSAMDSVSETQAATAKAVKTANDNAVAANRNANERVSKSGDSMSGTLNLDGVSQGTYLLTGLSNGTRDEKNYLRKMRGGEGGTIWHETVQQGNWRLATGSTDAQEELNLSTATGLRTRLEITSLSANGLRIAYGDYGTFWRNDGSNLYLMFTNKGDKFGSYNSLRPLWVNLETGALNSGSSLFVNNTINAAKEVTASYAGPYAWAEQYNAKAPFYNVYSTKAGSEYHPVLKQQATITGINSWTFSMGSLVGGNVLSWHLHMKESGGQDINYRWDTSGNFFAPGQIMPGSFANFDARFNLKNTASKAASGWEKDNSTGIMKQWGIATRSADSTRITFPTAFPNACVSVQLTLLFTNGFHDQNIYVQNPDRTGFTYVAGSGEVKVYFEARGY